MSEASDRARRDQDEASILGLQLERDSARREVERLRQQIAGTPPVDTSTAGEKWTAHLKQALENFVNNATDEELEQAFKDADFEIYRHVKEPVITNAEVAALREQLANLREAHILQKQIDDRKLASAEAALKQIDDLRPNDTKHERCPDPDCWPCKMWEIAHRALSGDSTALKTAGEAETAKLREALNMALDEVWFTYRMKGYGDLYCCMCKVNLSKAQDHEPDCYFHKLSALAASAQKAGQP